MSASLNPNGTTADSKWPEIKKRRGDGITRRIPDAVSVFSKSAGEDDDVYSNAALPMFILKGFSNSSAIS